MFLKFHFVDFEVFYITKEINSTTMTLKNNKKLSTFAIKGFWPCRESPLLVDHFVPLVKISSLLRCLFCLVVLLFFLLLLGMIIGTCAIINKREKILLCGRKKYAKQANEIKSSYQYKRWQIVQKHPLVC